MTDERVRALERRFQGTGAADDGAAWLAARLQAGDLSPRHLEIAYLCGHPAARALAPPRPLVDARQAGFVFQVSARGLLGWAKRGCPRVAQGRSFAFDLAAVVDWRASQPPKAHSGSRGRWESLLGNLVRAAGFHDPFAAYLGAVAALRASLERRDPMPLVEGAAALAARWLSGEAGRADVAAALRAYPALPPGAHVPTSTARWLLEAIERLGDDFSPRAGSAPENCPLYWTSGHGHHQIDRMGQLLDGLAGFGAGRDGRVPGFQAFRAYDRAITAAVAPALATWALGRPARSAPRPLDS